MAILQPYTASLLGVCMLVTVVSLSGLAGAEPSSWGKSGEEEDYPGYQHTALLRLFTNQNTTSDEEHSYFNDKPIKQNLGAEFQNTYDIYNYASPISKVGQAIRKRGHRIEFPCAGKNEHLSLGARPTVSTINITPGDILETLGVEASKAKRTTAAILQHYTDIGIDRIAPSIQINHLVSFSLTDRQAISGNILSIRVMLKHTYRELSRVAIILEKMAAEDNAEFGGLLEELKENGIYSLLCGLKVVMEAQHVSFSPAEIRQNTRLPPLSSRAERFARDYIVISRIESLLNDVGSQFSTLAIYL